MADLTNSKFCFSYMRFYCDNKTLGLVKQGNFLASYITISVSRWTLLQGFIVITGLDKAEKRGVFLVVGSILVLDILYRHKCSLIDVPQLTRKRVLAMSSLRSIAYPHAREQFTFIFIKPQNKVIFWIKHGIG
jgi:hypothetical protein